jgi:phenylacetate-CoA ligase
LGFHPGDIRSLDEIAALPTIDADTIRRHLDSMCTFQRPHSRVDAISTGGTGGKPLDFYIGPERTPIEYAHLVASWRRVGYEIGMPLAVLRGRILPQTRSGMRYEYDPFLRHHHYSTLHMTDEQMRLYLQHLRGIGPCFLHVYPSSVAALARFVRRSGIAPPENVKGIIAESEIVYTDQRLMVEEVFGCRYYSCYGQTEKVVAAAECEDALEYHVWPTYGYCELLDAEGRPVTTPGQEGEIVGTGFINRVVPFIRYRTGDTAVYVGDRCESCGRRHTLLREIRGHRIQEVLIAADGSEIPWTAINMHDDAFSHVQQFWFRQDQPGRARLLIIPAEGFGHGDQRRILRSLAEKTGTQLDITIELLEGSARPLAGKAVYVDQRIARSELTEP